MSIRRALVVDDSKAAGLALRRMLEQHSVAVDLADSGESALSYLESQMPDVIFMDHIMPGMNGLETAKVITADPKTAAVPIVMYTSTEGDSYLDKAKAHGAIGILPKPPKPAALAQWIRTLGGAPAKSGPAPATVAPPAMPASLSTPIALSAESIETLARGAAESVVRNGTQTLVARTIEEHLPQLRQDILARCETMAKQVAAEFLHARVQELASQLGTLQEQLTQLRTTSDESTAVPPAAAEIEILVRAVAGQAAREAAQTVAERAANEVGRRTANEVATACASVAEQLRGEMANQFAELRQIAESRDAASPSSDADMLASAQAAATEAAQQVAEDLLTARSAALADQITHDVSTRLAALERSDASKLTLAPEALDEVRSIARHVAAERAAESVQKTVREALQQPSQDAAKQAARLAARQLEKALEVTTRAQMSRVYLLTTLAAAVGVVAAFAVHALF